MQYIKPQLSVSYFHDHRAIMKVFSFFYLVEKTESLSPIINKNLKLSAPIDVLAS